MPLKRKTLAPRPDQAPSESVLSSTANSGTASILPGLMMGTLPGANQPVSALALDKLSPSPKEWNFYSPLPDGKFIELIDSIQRSGLLHPIVVWRQANGELTVLSGHNRLRAYKALYKNTGDAKYSTIPATVLENLTPDQAREIVIDSNWVQRNLTPSEKARSIYQKYMIAGRKARSANGTRVSNYDLIAKAYNLSGRQIARYIRLGSLDEGLQALVDEGRLSLSFAITLANFSPELQKYLAEHHADDLKKKQAALLRPDMNPAQIDQVLAGKRAEVRVSYTVPAELEARFRHLCEDWLAQHTTATPPPLPLFPEGDPEENGEDYEEE